MPFHGDFTRGQVPRFIRFGKRDFYTFLFCSQIIGKAAQSHGLNKKTAYALRRLFFVTMRFGCHFLRGDNRSAGNWNRLFFIAEAIKKVRPNGLTFLWWR